MKFKIFTLIMCLNLIIFSQENSAIWSKKIPKDEAQYLYTKIYQALRYSREKNKTIHVKLLNSKFYTGKIDKLGLNKFSLKTRGKTTVIYYNTISAHYISEIVPEDRKDGQFLYYLGKLYFHEGKKETAVANMQMAIEQNYQPKDKMFRILRENLESQKKKTEIGEDDETNTKVKDKDKNKVAKEKPKPNIPMLSNIGPGRIETAEHVAKEYFTIFLFTASWNDSSIAFEKEVANFANANNDLFILRNCQFRGRKRFPIAIQFKIFSIPSMIIFDEQNQEVARGAQQCIVFINNVLKTKSKNSNQKQKEFLPDVNLILEGSFDDDY